MRTRQPCYCGSGRRLGHCHGRGRDTAIRTLDDVRLATRAVFGRVDNPEYPIVAKGSCCLVRFRGDIWIVTAEHVLRTMSVPAHDVRVQVEAVRGRGLHFFKTVSTLSPIDRDQHDTAWLDLRMIRVAPGQVPHGFIDLDREPLAPLGSANFDDAVRVLGYPTCLDNAIDYERRHVAQECFSVDGAYWGLTSHRFVHAATFASFGKVASLDGMSGGPVFFAKSGGTNFYFAGTVVSGSVESRRIHFIDAQAIVKTLDWHYDEDPNGPSALASGGTGADEA